MNDWNVILDAVPDTWEGYPVDMDFRVGIQVQQIFYDADLSDREKTDMVCELIFPGIRPGTGNKIKECIEWYLGDWYHDREEAKKVATRAYDFDKDQWRIYAAFRMQYQIDLDTANMHYWKFMGLLSNLEECAFTRVKNIRLKKINSKMGREEKKALAEAKQIYTLDEDKKAIREAISEEEKAKKEAATEQFLKLAGRK